MPLTLTRFSAEKNKSNRVNTLRRELKGQLLSLEMIKGINEDKQGDHEQNHIELYQNLRKNFSKTQLGSDAARGAIDWQCAQPQETHAFARHILHFTPPSIRS